MGYSQPRVAVFQSSETVSALFILTLCVHPSDLSPAYTNYSNHPCSLSCFVLCYDTPWLRSCRYKPATADNAPDGDAPSLPHKQDAQPWGETRSLPSHTPQLFPQLESVWSRSLPPVNTHSPVYKQIPLDLIYWFRKFPASHSLHISLCSHYTYSLFPLWLTVLVTARLLRVLCQPSHCILMCCLLHW